MNDSSQGLPRRPAEIFISYRRTDGEGYVLSLSERLKTEFGDDKVFLDVDPEQLKGGENFINVIENKVNSSGVLLAVIGAKWLQVLKERMLQSDGEPDFVRIEIAAALARNIPVVPVLLNDAPMPAHKELPDDLKGLTHLNAFRVSSGNWVRDVGQLAARLKEILPRQRHFGPWAAGAAVAAILMLAAALANAGYLNFLTGVLHMNKINLRITFMLLMLACVCGSKNVFGQLCGPDKDAPVVTYVNRGGHRVKTVRKATTPYEAFADYHFDKGPISFFGFDSDKFYESGMPTGCAAKADLDNFASSLQSEPTAQAYIVVYGDDRDKSMAATKRAWASFFKDYLINIRGIDDWRIDTIDGGYMKEFTIRVMTGPMLNYKTSDVVELASPDCRTFKGAGYSACVPANWHQLSDKGETFAPAGAFKGPGLFTHGVEFKSGEGSDNLHQELEQFVKRLTAMYSDLRLSGEYRRVSVAGGEAMAVDLQRIDEDRSLLRTTIYVLGFGKRPPDANAGERPLLYLITTAPLYEYDGYQQTFNKILDSIKPS